MKKKIKKFLNSNSKEMKLARTIVQGVIGVLIANIDIIISMAVISPVMKPVIVALVMAILAPIMAELGNKLENK